MGFTFIVLLIALALFLALIATIEAGRRLGLARIRRGPAGLAQGYGAAEGAVFGLLGLLLAFSFSGAASRFEERRHLITVEANAIGTAWLRLDLLPADEQPPLRDLFRSYLDARLATYSNPDADTGSRQQFDRSIALQQQVWSRAIVAANRPDARPDAPKLLLPALNDMIDITTTRLVATRDHPPPVVYALLALMSLIGALLVGYSGATNEHRSVLHATAYAAVIAVAFYVILDLEFPRLGLIRVDDADRVLVELRQSLQATPPGGS